jgi:hypothetical protein
MEFAVILTACFGVETGFLEKWFTLICCEVSIVLAAVLVRAASGLGLGALT